MDIEGWEWTLFDREVAAGSDEDDGLPMQLLMEAHYCAPRPGNPRAECRVQHNETMESAADLVRFQGRLLRRGYVVVHRDDNSACQHCTELTLMRTQC